MLLALICTGYPVHAEARASGECEVMVPMLFLLETHTHAHTHGHPYAHARPLRLFVCARGASSPFFYTRIPALC